MIIGSHSWTLLCPLAQQVPRYKEGLKGVKGWIGDGCGVGVQQGGGGLGSRCGLGVAYFLARLVGKRGPYPGLR